MCTLDLACRFDLTVEPYLDDAELENLHSICTFEDLVRNEQSFYSRICGGYGFMKAEFGLGSTGSKHCKETALKAPARPGRAWPRPTSRLLGGKPLRVLLPKLICRRHFVGPYRLRFAVANQLLLGGQRAAAA